MREIVNLDPSCNADFREKATDTMCASAIHMYNILNLLPDQHPNSDIHVKLVH